MMSWATSHTRLDTSAIFRVTSLLLLYYHSCKNSQAKTQSLLSIKSRSKTLPSAYQKSIISAAQQVTRDRQQPTIQSTHKPTTMDAPNGTQPSSVQQPQPVQLHNLHTAQPPASQPMSTYIPLYLTLQFPVFPRRREAVSECKADMEATTNRPAKAAPRDGAGPARRRPQRLVPGPVLLLRAVPVAL